jgi:hypothetical protein
METAYLNCPREMLFVDGFKVERPTLPEYANMTEDAFQFKVDILAVENERALVSLPRVMTRGNSATAMVDMRYLY